MFTVHRNRTLTDGNRKCVICTETEHFPDDKSEMCIVHRNRTLTDGN